MSPNFVIHNNIYWLRVNLNLHSKSTMKRTPPKIMRAPSGRTADTLTGYGPEAPQLWRAERARARARAR